MVSECIPSSSWPICLGLHHCWTHSWRTRVFPLHRRSVRLETDTRQSKDTGIQTGSWGQSAGRRLLAPFSVIGWGGWGGGKRGLETWVGCRGAQVWLPSRSHTPTGGYRRWTVHLQVGGLGSVDKYEHMTCLWRVVRHFVTTSAWYRILLSISDYLPGRNTWYSTDKGCLLNLGWSASAIVLLYMVFLSLWVT